MISHGTIFDRRARGITFLIAAAALISVGACASQRAESSESAGPRSASAATPATATSASVPEDGSAAVTGPANSELPSTTTATTRLPATPSTVASPATEEVPSALWQTLPVTDSEGNTFTLGELSGTPVFVEFFATWCPTCRAQLGSTNEAAAAAGSTASFVALSTETELGPADMARYKADNSFDAIRFGVMSPEMLAAVVDAFGHDAANPPATPHVVVSATGAVGELHTGTADPATILQSLAGS